MGSVQSQTNDAPFQYDESLSVCPSCRSDEYIRWMVTKSPCFV